MDWERATAQRILEMDREGMFVAGVVGVPGIGKTVSSEYLRRELVNSGLSASVIGVDGFHYYKAELDQFEDPATMHFRRGAHFTFNAHKLLEKLRQLQRNCPVHFPEFKHILGDPIEDSILVTPSATDILIVEGLYLYCDLPIWQDIRSLINYKIFIDGDLQSAMNRLVARNSQCLGLSLEQAAHRMQHTDLLNAQEVLRSQQYADLIVPFAHKPRPLLADFE